MAKEEPCSTPDAGNSTKDDYARDREVRIRISVKHLSEVSLANQSFKARVQVEASWVEEKLKLMDCCKPPKLVEKEGYFRIANYESLNLKQDEGTLFHPRLMFANCLEEERQETWVEVYPGRQGEAPIVCWRFVSVAVFHEELELARFPFDHQDLSMILQTGWERHEVRLVKNQSSKYKSYVVTSNFVQKAEYELKSRLRFARARSDSRESATEKVYDQLKISMHVRRYTGYWVFNIGVPLFMISTCSLASYAAPAEEFDTRSSIVLAVLLAIIGFKYMIADKLPVINYSTLVDKYLLSCFTFVFVIISEQGLAKRDWSMKHAFSGGVITNDHDGSHEGGNLSVAAFCAVIGWFGVNITFVCFLMLTLFLWDPREYEYWTWPECAVWLGPVGDAQDEDVDNAAKRLGDSTSRTVVTVNVWEPNEAKETLEQALLSEQKSNTSNLSMRRSFWTSNKDAHEEKTIIHSDNVFDFNRKFVVVSYRTKEEAEKALDGLKTEKLKAELLNPEWRALAAKRPSTSSKRPSISSRQGAQRGRPPAEHIGMREPETRSSAHRLREEQLPDQEQVRRGSRASSSSDGAAAHATLEDDGEHPRAPSRRRKKKLNPNKLTE